KKDKGGCIWTLKPQTRKPGDSEGLKPEGATSTSPQNIGALGDVGAFDDSANLDGAKAPIFVEGAKNAQGAEMPKGADASPVAPPDREMAGVREPGEDDENAMAVFPGVRVVACSTCGGIRWQRAGDREVCVVCHPGPERTA